MSACLSSVSKTQQSYSFPSCSPCSPLESCCLAPGAQVNRWESFVMSPYFNSAADAISGPGLDRAVPCPLNSPDAEDLPKLSRHGASMLCPSMLDLPFRWSACASPSPSGSLWTSPCRPGRTWQGTSCRGQSMQGRWDSALVLICHHIAWSSLVSPHALVPCQLVSSQAWDGCFGMEAYSL